MKRILILTLTLSLMLPALAYAGSATSRWDMSIGGYVKFDMGYTTQAQNQDLQYAQRSGGLQDNLADKYGNFYSYAGETRLNFLIQGPDAWGARTMAFVEADFRGNQANGSASSNAGTFSLRHAFMQFGWPNSKLVIGQTWQTWGLLPTYANASIGNNDLSPFLKGIRQPLVRFEQTFGKDWIYKVGVISPTNSLGSGSLTGNGETIGSNVDGYTLSQMPFFEGSLGWSSDKCGNIGPWKMLFALEGFWGQQKMITGITTGNNTLTYQDKNLNSWGMSFKGFIPMIPEKKGDKAGALSASGVLFYTQNPGMFMSSSNNGNGYNANYGYTSGVYNTLITNVLNLNTATGRTAYLGLDYAAPTQYGGWGQVSYFITDKLFVNGWYGYLRSNVSQAWMNSAANTNAVVNTTQIIANILYDVNAAVRVGIEYAWYSTRYAGYPALLNGVPTLSKDGNASSFRVGAYYFF